MKSFFTKRILAGLIAFGAAAAFILVLVHATAYVPENSNYAPASVGAAAPGEATTTPATDPPVLLSIPSLSLHAHVQQVGLTAAGNMGVPNNFTDVAWYKYGPAPGQNGSAVIDGHVDNALSLPGVFKHLADIKPGADIYVITKSGSITHFIVSSATSYAYTDFPNQLVFGRTDAVRLNLITCAGTWQQGQHMYDRRLVVYAVKAPQ